MSQIVSLGETLPLSFQLFNYDPTKYVRAYLRDADDNLVDEYDLEPIDELGMYTNMDAVMIDTPFMTAQYVVYDDSNYQDVSTSQGGGNDTFILDSLEVEDLLPLYVQSFNYDAGKYPRAFVTDQDNNPIAGSPFDLSPLGVLGLYGNNSVLVPDNPFVNVQYVFYEDSDYQTVSGDQGAGNDTFLISQDLQLLIGVSLPNVNDALNGYFQPMIFTKVLKKVSQFQITEKAKNIRFRGVWQPYTAQQLVMKPEGQRAWKWFMLHSDPSLALIPDEVVKYGNTQYRVMEKYDYSKYGYIDYRLVEDYTGAGPS